MGFGLLFIGYFLVTLLTLNPFASLFRVLGYGIILMAGLKLRKYHRSFDYFLFGTVGMLLVAALLAFSDASEYLYRNLLIDSVLITEKGRTVLGYVEQGVSFLFHSALLFAIRKLAKETEVEKIAVNAVRNFVFICFYYFVYIISFLPVKSIQSCAAELALIAWIVYFVWIILNFMLIFSCYVKICDESDVDMERKPSRFAFVNQFRAEMDRRQEKAIEESRAYRKSKQEKRRGGKK